MSKPSLVVLAVEGLRASALGAYGAIGYSTPALDELAACGTTFEWCYTPIAERKDSYDIIWQAMHNLADDYGDGLLVTDYHPVLDQHWRHVFSAMYGLKLDPRETHATDIAEAQLAEVFTRFIENVADFSPPYDNRLVWLHTQGLAGPWDAPLELSRTQCEEDDPPPYDGLTPPAIQIATSDEVFSASAAYAAQVQVLDACVAALRAALAELPWGPVDFCLLGLDGFALGEHGVVGHDDQRLYSERTHVPVIIARADGAGAFQRQRGVVSLDRLLANRLVAPAEETPVQIASPSGAQVLRTSQWLLRRAGASSPPELYAKPDDHWEANNVADRLPEETAELISQLAPQSL